MIQSLLQNAEGEQVKSHEELRNRRCFSFWTYWTATGPSILSRTYWTATGPSILSTAGTAETTAQNLIQICVVRIGCCFIQRLPSMPDIQHR